MKNGFMISFKLLRVIFIKHFKAENNAAYSNHRQLSLFLRRVDEG